MLIVMAVTLYTSRVILEVLGATDYGIYNVIGGVVTLMSFLNGALSSSTSRFLTYELGRKDMHQLKQTFSASLNLHIAVAILVVLLAETIGLWFFFHKMTIPADRMQAAFWVYQFSIVTTVVSFTQVPYNASLISHENMSIYAFVGLYEALSKLLIVYLITLSPIDKLVFYSLLLMLNSVCIQIFYRGYTSLHYSECRFRWIKDTRLYKKLLGYSGWDLFGGVAVVSQGQGINILLNMFFGPVVNAARAIALQMQVGLSMFVTNYLMAVRPQVIKRFADSDYPGMYKLMFYTTKFSYLLMLGLILPFFFELKFVLHLWLGDNVPDQTVVFTRIILIIGLLQTVQLAQQMVFHAIGRIKIGNIVGGSLMIMALPVSYVALKLGFPAYSVFLIIMVCNVWVQLFGLYLIHRYVPFELTFLLKDVYLPCAVVSLLALPLPALIIFSFQQSLVRLIVTFFLSEAMLVILVWIIALNSTERKMVLGFIQKKMSKFRTNNYGIFK